MYIFKQYNVAHCCCVWSHYPSDHTHGLMWSLWFGIINFNLQLVALLLSQDGALLFATFYFSFLPPFEIHCAKHFFHLVGLLLVVCFALSATNPTSRYVTQDSRSCSAPSITLTWLIKKSRNSPTKSRLHVEKKKTFILQNSLFHQFWRYKYPPFVISKKYANFRFKKTFNSTKQHPEMSQSKQATAF